MSEIFILDLPLLRQVIVSFNNFYQIGIAELESMYSFIWHTLINDWAVKTSWLDIPNLSVEGIQYEYDSEEFQKLAFCSVYSLISSSMNRMIITFPRTINNIDADGLRDYILNYGFVTKYNNSHQSLDNYYLLADDDMNDIDIETQSQIRHMRLGTGYDSIKHHSEFDFSDYHFIQLQTLIIGRFGLLECQKIYFTSTKWLYCIKCIDLPSLEEIIIEELVLQQVSEVAFIGRKLSFVWYIE